MFKNLTHPAILAGAVLLSACQGMETQRAEKMPSTGSAFDRALYGEYLDLSKWEWAQGDYGSADYYAVRAESAAQGRSVSPELLANRKLPPSAVSDIDGARARLTGQLAAGAGQKVPAPTARAQAMLDCWMEQQEENRQPQHIAYCRDSYSMAMSEVDNAMRPGPVAYIAPAPAPSQPGPSPRWASYVVYFPFDSDKLTVDAHNTIMTAVGAAKTYGKLNVVITGYTDTSGSSDYNQRLSEKRSLSVAKIFEDHGINASSIDEEARGETQLAVQTPDNVRNSGNRRATITIKE